MDDSNEVLSEVCVRVPRKCAEDVQWKRELEYTQDQYACGVACACVWCSACERV